MAQVFHIRTVNGSAIPVPKELRIAENTIDKDSYRSASGLLVRNPLGKKMKFFLTSLSHVVNLKKKKRKH